jgi:hypothetical protein
VKIQSINKKSPFPPSFNHFSGRSLSVQSKNPRVRTLSGPNGKIRLETDNKNKHCNVENGGAVARR